MRISLFWKLTGAFAIAILIGLGGALLATAYSTTVAFEQYAHGAGLAQTGTTTMLTDYYAEHRMWAGAEEVLERGRGHGRGNRQGGLGETVRLADANGIILIDPDPSKIGRPASQLDIRNGTPLVVDGERVGTLLIPTDPVLDARQTTFLRQVRGLLILAGGSALAIALILGAFLVRSITRPLNQLTAASEAIAAGQLDTRVAVKSGDEVGQLAAAFNRMAADLARAEESRRQQTADIAHELRTPLTIIQGHLEAFADGIFPPDEEHMAPVMEQAELLARLVQDLRTLSLADAGRLTLHPTPTDLVEWATRLINGFQAVASDRQIDLELDLAPDLPKLSVDRERLAQVVGNLIDNALRHTPPGGSVAIDIARQDDKVQFSVRDDGPGVPPEQLPYLFKRFWRGDPSRSRHTGGSGLGLAIARRIVEGHGGSIWAANAPGGGLEISFSIPRGHRDA